MTGETKSKTVSWFDRDTYETIRLVAKNYGLSVEKIVPSGTRRCEAVLSGRSEHIDRLTDDIRMFGTAEPFIASCPSTRSEYLDWLKFRLAESACGIIKA